MINNTALIIGVVVPISLTLGGLVAFIIRTEVRRKKGTTVVTSVSHRPRHHSYIFGGRRNGNTRLDSATSQIEDGIEVCKILPAQGGFSFNDHKTALELEDTSDMHHAGFQGGITRQVEVQVRSESVVQDFALGHDNRTVAYHHQQQQPRTGDPEKIQQQSQEESYCRSPPPSPCELPDRPYPRESFRLSKPQSQESNRAEAIHKPASQLREPVKEPKRPQPLLTRSMASDHHTTVIITNTPPSSPPPPLPTNRISRFLNSNGRVLDPASLPFIPIPRRPSIDNAHANGDESANTVRRHKPDNMASSPSSSSQQQTLSQQQIEEKALEQLRQQAVSPLTPSPTSPSFPPPARRPISLQQGGSGPGGFDFEWSSSGKGG